MSVIRFFLGLFGTLPPPRPHHRSRVDSETRDAISDEEHARIASWAKAAKLEERGIGLDTGCAGGEPRGVELVVPLRGLAGDDGVLITEKRRSEHALDVLFDDLTLSGSLASVTVSPENVTLRFVPRRAPEVYDVALRRLGEVIAEMNAVRIENPQVGPYR